MVRQGRHGFALAAAVGFWLTGCAALDVASADPSLALLAGRLDTDDWRVDPGWTPAAPRDGFRWRFGESPPEVGEAERLRTLSRRPGRAGRNAAVLLARLDPADARPVAERLAGVVRGEREGLVSAEGFAALASRFRSGGGSDQARDGAPPVATRAAAAEAWCRLLAAGDGPIEDRLAEPGRLWTRTELPDAVRAELLRGLARHLPPERIVGYAELFGDAASASVELRRAAIEGCVLFAASRPDRPFDPDDWPASVENAGLDADTSVRSEYGRWLAVARHPDAVPRLEAQLADADPEVSRSAIRSLGLLKTDEARELLRRVAGRPGELPRAAAVESLAGWGPAEVRPFLRDESPHVRRAAVAGLAGSPSPEAAVLLDDALTDADLDTQQRAVAATRDWPDEFALPVLLSGLQNAATRTRRECLAELRRRTGRDDPFPVTAPQPERAAAVAELAAKRGWPSDAMTRFRLAATGRDAAGAAEPAEDVAALLERIADPSLDAAAREAAFRALREAGPSTAAAVEAFCLSRPGPAADALAANVLPALDPAHAALAELASTDVATRRRGAGRLAELGRSATLGPLVLRRLQGLLTREQDGLVWRQAMAAIAADATPEAERVALLAVNHTWPDVRRLGCEYVGRHRRSHQAAWLSPLLSDANDAVRLAAIEAAGRCGNPALIGGAAPGAVPTGLRAAAADPSRPVRFAALAALARLGDESGAQGLLRWAEYEPPSERAAAVRAIGATGLRRFEPDLVRLAGTERDPLVRRELLAALEAIVPPGQRPPGTDVASAGDRLAAWGSRWEGVAGSSTMTAPSGGTP